jgi:putative flippase GtrA
MLARSARYIIEGTLAVFYGEVVLWFLKTYGPRIVAVVLSVAITSLIVYLLWQWRTKTSEAAHETE